MLPHELCARLTNASVARHRFVGVVPSSQHLSLLTLLLSHGFLTSLHYGTADTSSASTPPVPAAFPHARLTDRRIWAELKYRHDRPVLQSMALVSKPSRRVVMDSDEVRRFVRGNRVRFVAGLRQGEIGVVRTNQGWMEGREAVSRALGGELVARVG